MLTFAYEVLGAGWSRATIADGTSELTMRVSYLSDALRDLTDAVIALMRGADHAACTWHDEPGGYVWTFEQVDGELRLTITEGQHVIPPFDGRDILERILEGPGILFSTQCPLRRFAGQVLTQLWRVFSDMGLAEYKEAWGRYEFPLAEYRTLEELMKRGEGR